jgi:hypothetical protein
MWTENFGAPTAANIHRIEISLVVGGDDDDVRDVGRRIANAISTWWATVSAWIEITYGQDLSRLGPVEPGIKPSGTTMWSRLYSLHCYPLRAGEILPVGSSAVTVVWPISSTEPSLKAVNKR